MTTISKTRLPTTQSLPNSKSFEPALQGKTDIKTALVTPPIIHKLSEKILHTIQYKGKTVQFIQHEGRIIIRSGTQLLGQAKASSQLRTLIQYGRGLWNVAKLVKAGVVFAGVGVIFFALPQESAGGEEQKILDAKKLKEKEAKKSIKPQFKPPVPLVRTAPNAVRAFTTPSKTKPFLPQIKKPKTDKTPPKKQSPSSKPSPRGGGIAPPFVNWIKLHPFLKPNEQHGSKPKYTPVKKLISANADNSQAKPSGAEPQKAGQGNTNRNKTKLNKGNAQSEARKNLNQMKMNEQEVQDWAKQYNIDREIINNTMPEAQDIGEESTVSVTRGDFFIQRGQLKWKSDTGKVTVVKDVVQAKLSDSKDITTDSVKKKYARIKSLKSYNKNKDKITAKDREKRAVRTDKQKREDTEKLKIRRQKRKSNLTPEEETASQNARRQYLNEYNNPNDGDLKAHRQQLDSERGKRYREKRSKTETDGQKQKRLEKKKQRILDETPAQRKKRLDTQKIADQRRKNAKIQAQQKLENTE